MNENDDDLLRLADAVLDARPIDWAAIASRIPDEQRRLIANLRSVADISAFHLDSSLSARSASIDSTAVSTGGIAGADALPLSTQWGPLTLTGWIGRGRFGDVYRARDGRLDRPVALKLLRQQARDADEAGSAVIEEGRLMARVRHPNVVTVYGAERVEGRVGLWMELVDGRTLEEELRQRGPLPWTEVCRIGSELSQALAAVHRAGLLHRDLKAQNVLRETSGRVVLADFGAGRILSHDDDDHVDVAGTPLYLAPEVFEGKPATATSDVYSLGVLLFHLVTASYPVRGRSIADLREAHRQQRRTSLREARADLPAAFVAVVERALAADSRERCATAEDLGVMLDGLLVKRTVAPSSRVSWRTLAFTIVALMVIAPLPVTLWLREPPSSGGGQKSAPTAGGEPERDSEPRRVRLRSFQVDVGSYDGSVIPYLDEQARFQLLHLATGRSTLLTEVPPPPEFPGKSVASPNGDRVAFGWSLGPSGFELRIINGDGTWPRVLISRQTAYEPVPVDWSRDGMRLLCWLHQKNGSADLVFVPVDGGPVSLIYSIEVGAPSNARLSPDGRFIVANIAVPQSRAASVIVIDTGTLASHVLAENTLIDGEAQWTPDGRRVLFQRASTEKTGAIDAWIVGVEDGVASGEPVRYMANVGFARIALTDRGEWHRRLRVTAQEVYTRSIDLSGRNDAGPPSRIQAGEVGSHGGPAWSPDGASIAYFTTRPSDLPGANPLRTLTIQDVQTGQVRLVQLPMAFLSGYTPRWSPDGKSIVVAGWDRDDTRAGYYRVDAHTGDLTALVITDTTSVPAASDFSADGEHFLYRDPSRGIIARSLVDETEAIVVPVEKRDIDRFFVAPDGHAIALIRSVQIARDRWIRTLEVRQQDGIVRELARRTTPRWLDLHGWTSDARDVIYSDSSRFAEPAKFYRVSEHGGPPIDLRFAAVATPNTASLSPDGRRIAYTERVVEYDVWIAPFASEPYARRP